MGMILLQKITLAFALSLAGFMTALPASADMTCALLVDADGGAILSRSGDCEKAATPASTFKIPLAVMGYDSGILTEADQPAWAFKEGYPDWIDDWKTTVTPRYWLEKSVVWYSQELTRKLGPEKFRAYVDAFDYGNGDVSGDRGLDNGLTHAWLRSSLQISPLEQAAFLDKLVNRKLGVSDRAYEMTYAVMPTSALPDGWVVSGKTGTSYRSNADGSPDAQKRQLGWFVGWAEKGDRKAIFVYLIEDQEKQQSYAGPRAKAEALDWLPGALE